MTPFREKPVNWHGDDENGRYKNNGGYKYDIINHSMVRREEDMPECFLADTPEEADSLYEKFERFLNSVSSSYSMTTGLNKADLFGEGLIGLGRAYRDWDPSRSDKFASYAKFRIKDAIGEFIRNNASAISVPSYIKKAHTNLQEIKSICESACIDWHTVVYDQELPDDLGMSDAVRCAELVSNLINAANRAKVSYLDFLKRVSMTPQDVEYVDQTPPEVHRREIEMLEAAVLVEKMKEKMDGEELYICEGIMLDKSYEQIGKEMDKSKAWVSSKLKNLRTRILTIIHEGGL